MPPQQPLFNPTKFTKFRTDKGWVFPVRIDVMSFQESNLTVGAKFIEYSVAWERTALAVARFLLLESMNYVPIETGLLASTGKANVKGSGYKAEGEVTFSTSYARYVYYDPKAVHGSRFNVKYAAEIAAGQTHSRRPEEQYKWIQVAKDRNIAEINRIIELEMYRKGAANFMIRTAGRDLYDNSYHRARFPISRNPFRLR